MTADALINLTLPFLKPEDDVQTAVELFTSFKLNWLPVISGKNYLGMLSEDFILDEDPDILISALRLEKTGLGLSSNAHFYEALRLMNQNGVNLLPVINSQNEFLGALGVNDIFVYFGNLGFINASGGILVISVTQSGYSLSELSRIIESNDMKVLSLFVSDNPDNGLESFITFKFNKTDLSRLIASLERFGYNIVADFHESSFQHYETERLEMLFKYLNI